MKTFVVHFYDGFALRERSLDSPSLEEAWRTMSDIETCSKTLLGPFFRILYIEETPPSFIDYLTEKTQDAEKS